MPKEPAHILRMRGIQQEESLLLSIPFSIILLMRAAGQKHQPLRSAAPPCFLMSWWVQERWHYWTTKSVLPMPFSIYSQETTASIVKYQRKSKCFWENRWSEVVYKSKHSRTTTEEREIIPGCRTGFVLGEPRSCHHLLTVQYIGGPSSWGDKSDWSPKDSLGMLLRKLVVSVIAQPAGIRMYNAGLIPSPINWTRTLFIAVQQHCRNWLENLNSRQDF